MRALISVEVAIDLVAGQVGYGSSIEVADCVIVKNKEVDGGLND